MSLTNLQDGDEELPMSKPSASTERELRALGGWHCEQKERLRMKFSASIWTKGGGFSVYPISTVEVPRFSVKNWPIEGRSALYHLAVNAVEAAKAGQLTPDEAREALVTFLDDGDALAEGSSMA